MDATKLQPQHNYLHPYKQEPSRLTNMGTYNCITVITNHLRKYLYFVCLTGSSAHNAWIGHFERLSGEAASPQLCLFTPGKQLTATRVRWLHRYAQVHRQQKQRNTSLEMSTNKERVNCQNTWAVKRTISYSVSFISHGLICSYSSPSSPIPSMIAHHASVYLVQLPGTDCGQVGPLPARPSAPPNRFSSQTLFLSLSMAEPGSRSCQVHWSSVGKRVGRVSRRAVHVYYFRLLAVLPERLWGKSLKRHTNSCLFRVKQACQCFILKMFQQDFLLIRIGQMLRPESNILTVQCIPACVH